MFTLEPKEQTGNYKKETQETKMKKRDNDVFYLFSKCRLFCASMHQHVSHGTKQNFNDGPQP